MKQIRSLLNRSNSETRGQQSGAGPSAVTEEANVLPVAPPEQPAELERGSEPPAPG